MLYKEIKDACDYIALHPNEPPTVSHLALLQKEAQNEGYALAFLIGNNLFQEPYVQGYTLEPIQQDLKESEKTPSPALEKVDKTTKKGVK